MSGPAAPPIERTASGAVRRVGVEIEFGGLTAHEAAAAIAREAGCSWRADGPHLARVSPHGLGEIRVVLDTGLARPKPDAVAAKDLEAMIERLGEDLAGVAADVLSLIAPTEIATAPIPWDRLDELTPLIEALRRAGAVGTRDTAISAYGMHLNPEIWRLEASEIWRVAAAYGFLEPWLRDWLEVDRARRLAPFVDPWPRAFVRALADREAPPNAATLIAMAARHVPSRNYGLDLWPILGALNARGVRRARGRPAKSPRPAFHYRLPDADIERPGWSVLADWEVWTRIEAVALDDRRLAEARAAWLRFATGGRRAAYDAAAARLAGVAA